MRIQIVNKGEGLYKGINRQLKINDNACKRDFKELLLWLDKTDGQNSLPLNEENLLFSIQYLENLKQKKQADIILFGEINELNEFGEFLGYDVSGDSMFFSPLFVTFFENPNRNLVIKLIHHCFISKINDNGLFGDLEDACEFSALSTYLNDIVVGSFFEPDDNIRPIAVYSLKR